MSAEPLSPSFPAAEAEAPSPAKLRALAEFAAGAGHEINNPIATIVGHVQLLLAGETDPERRRALLTIGGQAYRIRDMIGDVMLFARPPVPVPRTQNLVDLLREVLQAFSAELRERNIRCHCHCPADEIPVWADPAQLRVVVGQLLKNSLEAVPPGGQIDWYVQPVVLEGGPAARFSIRDTGPGLSATSREHLFDPFFSGRQAGRGLGFGLSKCWRIVTQHGGKISVQEPPSGGLELTVDWPASPRPPAADAPHAASSAITGQPSPVTLPFAPLAAPPPATRGSLLE